MQMLEYFEEQLKTVPSLDEHGARAMIDVRLANGGDEVELTKYYTSKIGQRLVFFMVSDNTNVQILKCFEDEVESELKDYTFVEMIGATPKFKK